MATIHGTIYNDNNTINPLGQFSPSLSGTAQSDTIYGRQGNDILLGLGGNDILVGGEFGNHVEIDRMTGGSGADRFILGDYHGNLYSVVGNYDYARITDFQTGNVDTIQLDLGNYSLAASPINSISGTAIYANGTELIAILEGVNRTSLYFENGTFTTTLRSFGLASP